MTQAPVADQLADYIASQRWFGGKGREFTVDAVRPLGLGLHVVEIAYTNGDSDLYQVPMSSFVEAQPHLGHALIGQWDGRHHYDAVHDRAATRSWLGALSTAAGAGDVVAHRVEGQSFTRDLDSTVFSGEQSNSSLAFGDDSMLKLFRRLTPGVNPDIEIHAALTRAGSTHVARLLGWLDSGDPQLALLQEFLSGSTEGWALALDSVGGLLDGRESPDFTEEARLLGVAVAEVHETLRQVLPTGTLPGEQIAASMRERFGHAAALAPALRADAERIARIHDDLTGLDVPAQRIHADLHLGQTLRTPQGWKLVDFEGEPARSLAQRTLPDSQWRDVAGMLRSFDYAARVAQREGSSDPVPGSEQAHAADDWVRRNRRAFLDGYQHASTGFSSTDLALIRAFEIDKAVYEVSYEARNRPGWIDIPLTAISRTLEDDA